MCGDDGFGVKPAPDPVIAVCHAFRTEPERVAVVGDTPADIAMARAAGAGLVIGVRSGVGSSHDLGVADVVIDPVGGPAPLTRHGRLSAVAFRYRWAIAPEGTRPYLREVPSSGREPVPEPARRRTPATRATGACPSAPPDPTRGRRPQPDRGQGQRTPELSGLFDDIIDEAFALFGVDRAGLWLYDPPRTRPLTLAAPPRPVTEYHRRGVIAPRRRQDGTGMDALRRSAGPRARPRDAHHDPVASAGLPRDRRRSVCFVPLVFGEERLGLLVLYHREAYPWTRRRARAGSCLRRPDGHGDRRRPAGRFPADARGSADLDRGAHRAGSASCTTRRPSPGRSWRRPSASPTTTRSGSTASTTTRAPAKRSRSRGRSSGPRRPHSEALRCRSARA